MESIPCLFLPGREIRQTRESLQNIANCCIFQKKSEGIWLMRLAVSGLVKISREYDSERFGFGPGELVMTPNQTISLSVGITADLANPVVWFVSGNELPGVSYWPGGDNPTFFANKGFARVVAGD